MSSEDSELIKLMRQLKESQDDYYNDYIREKALEKLEKSKDNYLSESDMFYVGAIDFMVEEINGQKKFFILETNGGSSRGLSCITEKQQKILYTGYWCALEESIKKNRREDGKLLILVGVPIDDALLYEKFIYIELFKKKLSAMGYTAKEYTDFESMQNFPEDVAFLVVDYRKISADISYKDSWIMYRDQKVNLLLGDGIARRIRNDKFKQLIRTDFRQIHTVIANPIYLVTDDKSLTYLAEFYAKEKMEKYRVKYLKFSKGLDEKDLLQKMDYVVKNYKENFIIKPNGGSGGAGIIPISSDEDPANFNELIEKSKEEFFKKFLKNRDPYPYTIMEMANFSLIDWRGGKHTFDIRIYLSQQEGKIVPIGGLTRIARNAYRGTLDKQEFVVNLSGYDGHVEADRGLGISPKMRDLLNLSDEDFVDMFCIGVVLFKDAVDNYYKIINFNDWSKIIE